MAANENIIDVIKELKTTAKSKRDSNEFKEAEEVINTAIKKIDTVLAKKASFSEEKTNKLTFELADCYGILGGIYRRWGYYEKNNPELQKEKFKFSYKAYDDGYKFEKASGSPNSYNMLNRLVSRIFFQPEWLQAKSEESPDKKYLINELELAEKEVQSQIDEERTDVWALADFGMIRVLLNKPKPEEAFKRFVDEAPPSYAYTILLDTLNPLSELNTDAKGNLIKAINYLQLQSQ
jgi:hypothetical protein